MHRSTTTLTVHQDPLSTLILTNLARGGILFNFYKLALELAVLYSPQVMDK